MFSLSLARSLFLSLSPNRSISRSVRRPSSSRSRGRSSLALAHTWLSSPSRARPARRSSLSHALSAWPTHRNKFHPPTLPLTHFLPTDHPLRPIGKQATRLSRRPIFRRPKKGDKGHFFLEPRLRLYVCVRHGVSLPHGRNYARVIVIRKLYVSGEQPTATRHLLGRSSRRSFCEHLLE